MLKLKLISLIGLCVATISPAFGILNSAAQPLRQSSQLHNQIAIQFPPASDRGAPQRTTGGGTRGKEYSCTEGKTPLTALMPNQNNVGTTFAGNPSFFVYIPATTAKQAEFVLVDDQGNDIYVNQFALPATPGIVQINLPTTVSLQIDKYESWQFSLICNPGERNRDEFIQGFIRRMELSEEMNQNLTKANPLEKAKIYAEASAWQETISTLVTLRNSYPSEWEQLLKSVGLEQFISEPLTPLNPGNN